MEKRAFKLSELIVVIVVTALFSAIIAGFVSYYNFSKNNKEEYVDLTSDKDLQEFLEVYASLVSDYYEDIDRDELLDSAMSAMMSYLDELYTTKLTEGDTENLMSKLSGLYEGIGVSITQDRVITEVFKDSPAEKAGILADDLIIGVNGEDVTEKTSDYIVKLIKEAKNATITIKIKRGEEEKEFKVTRATLNVPSVSNTIIEDTKIGYIYISTFSNTTASQFAESLQELESKGIESLIIDVRSNSGGYLLSAKQIASLFLEPGKIIYSLKDKNGQVDYKDETKEKRTYPITVLINGSSASASEILAAALKDSYGATLVGETSYGKGKVQQTKELDDGSLIKYTSAKWLRPNGECIDEVGIKPDFEAKLELSKDNKVVDTQLEKAVSLYKEAK